MKRNVYGIALMVAITGLSCTVPIVHVSAQDTIQIVNSVRSSSHSGGITSQSGQDGEAGEDGRDGQSGASAAGASVTTVLPGTDSSAVITTNSVAVGDTVATSAVTQVVGASDNEVMSMAERETELRRLLSLLQQTISKYVQLVF